MAQRNETRTRPTASLLFACALAAMPAYAQRSKSDATPAHPRAESPATKARSGHEGIWKWVVPPVRMKGMFNDHDPIGLVAGKLIPADCAFNWTDPDSHKLYCFTSATSLVYFLDSPQTYLAEAEKNWRALKPRPGKAR